MGKPDSDIEIASEEECPELADAYSSSSYSPSTDDLYSSDSDASLKSGALRRIKNTSKRKRISDSSATNSRGSGGSDFVPQGSKSINQENTLDSISGYETDISEDAFQRKIRTYLDEVKNIKENSGDAKTDFRMFMRRLLKRYTQFTPEQNRKLRTLDIKMEDIVDNETVSREFIPFSSEEIETIKENWNCFCEDYGFDSRNDWKMFLPRLTFIRSIKMKQRDMFKHYIAQHLPNRRRHDVFLKFSEIYHHSGRLQEKFTHEEDELLILCCEMSKNVRNLRQNHCLSFILQRPTYLLEERKNFLSPSEPKPVSFKLKKTAVNSSFMGIKDCPKDEYPEWTRNEEAWKELAESSGQYSVKQLKKSYFRRLYPSVKARKGVRSLCLERLLITWLSKCEECTWENVDWKIVGGRPCNYVGAVKVYSVLRKLTKKYVPQDQWHDLQAAVNILRTNLNKPQVSFKLKKTAVNSSFMGIKDCPKDEYPEWTRNEEAWKELAESSGQYSVKQLKKSYFRRLYPSVKARKGIRSLCLERLLITWLSKCEECTWENVDWKIVGGRPCNYVGAVKVYSVLRKLTKQYVPQDQWHDLQAVVNILRTKLNIPQVIGKRRSLLTKQWKKRNSGSCALEKISVNESNNIVMSDGVESQKERIDQLDYSLVNGGRYEDQFRTRENGRANSSDKSSLCKSLDNSDAPTPQRLELKEHARKSSKKKPIYIPKATRKRRCPLKNGSSEQQDIRTSETARALSSDESGHSEFCDYSVVVIPNRLDENPTEKLSSKKKSDNLQKPIWKREDSFKDVYLRIEDRKRHFEDRSVYLIQFTYQRTGVVRQDMKLRRKASQQDEDGFFSSQGKYEGLLSHLSEIDKLQLSEELKNKLITLCERVERTFRISPSQRQKIEKFSVRVAGFDVTKRGGKFKMTRGIWRSDGEELFNVGAFTAEEIETTKTNYCRFCEKFNFDPDEDINIFLPNAFANRNGIDALTVMDQRVFVYYLSKNIPDRPPRSVYSKFIKMFYFYRRGPFSTSEDELLRSWYELNPGKHIYSILGRILHRSRLLVRRRLLRLIGDNSDKVRERKQIASYKPPYIEDILEREKDVYPDWTKSEEAWENLAGMTTQYNIKELKKSYFLQVYPSVRATKRVKSLPFKRSLIKMLSSMKNPTWENVDWVKLGEECFNVGAVRVYSVIRKLTRKYAPKENWSNLADAVQRIKQNCPKLTRIRKKKIGPSNFAGTSQGGSQVSTPKRRRRESSILEDTIKKKSPRKNTLLIESEEIIDSVDEYALKMFTEKKAISEIVADNVETANEKPSQTSLKEFSETEKVEDVIEHVEVLESSRRKKKRKKLETVLETSENGTQEDIEAKKLEDETPDSVQPKEIAVSSEFKRKRSSLKTPVEVTVETPSSEAFLKEDTKVEETKEEKSKSPRHKKKRAKFGTDEMRVELHEEIEEKKINDVKSNADELGEVMVSPRGKKKRGKSETIDESEETRSSDLITKDDVGTGNQESNAVELGEVMVSPRGKKKRGKSETIDESEETRSSDLITKDDVGTGNQESNAVELGEVMVSPRGKKKRGKSETIDESEETRCSDLITKDDVGTGNQESNAVELSQIMVFPRRKKKQKKTETVEEVAGTNRSKTNNESKNDSDARIIEEVGLNSSGGRSVSSQLELERSDLVKSDLKEGSEDANETVLHSEAISTQNNVEKLDVIINDDKSPKRTCDDDENADFVTRRITRQTANKKSKLEIFDEDKNTGITAQRITRQTKKPVGK
ncbi:hypothetical protein GE061_016681 [Apolygus lucorum]|uniref:Uncharacterized protein n=1 Tax=Apolygus lucorum TaxID=248454 RepID=A0A8S9XI10_APOLU|nr:hypothetical protein GE061_016681 [Apolygus lucorum]